MPAYEKLTEKPLVESIPPEADVIIIHEGKVKRVKATDLIQSASAFVPVIKNKSTYVVIDAWQRLQDGSGYRATITDADVTSSAVVNVSFSLDSLSVAEEAEVKPISQTSIGSFFLYAKNVPTAALYINYCILKAGE